MRSKHLGLGFRAASSTMLLLLLLPFATLQAQAVRAITQLSGDLYRAQNDRHFTVFLVTDEGIILGDPISTEFSIWLKGELRKRFNKDVKYVLYSHHHADHASGGAVFADTARFVGHENFHSYLITPPAGTPLSSDVAPLDVNRNGSIEPSEARDRLKRDFSLFDHNRDGVLDGVEIARGPFAEVRAPDITYRDRLTISLGGRSVELTWAGALPHSTDMSVIRFPREKTIYVVDFIQIKSLPFGKMGTAHFDEWLSSIRNVEQMDFTTVSPGHNVIGTKADIADFRGYLQDLRAAVRKGIESGTDVRAMQTSAMLDKYRNWFMYDAWRPDNVAGMYELLKGSGAAGKAN